MRVKDPTQHEAQTHALQDQAEEQPAFFSLEKPSLAYFDLWHRHLLMHAFERRVERNLQAAHTQPELREVLTDVLLCQHVYELESTSIKFLHHTALKMCDAVLAPDANAPEFPAPGQTLWLQPLGSLTYRDQQIVGFFVHRPFDAVLLEKNPYLQMLSRRGKEWVREFLATEKDWMLVYLITTAPDPEGHEAVEHIITHKFGEYYDGTWHHGDVQTCPTHTCTLEEVSAGVQIPILCAECAQELDYWSRYLTTLLWIVNGRLRQPHDTEPNPQYSETLEQKDLLTQKKHKRRYTGEIIRYDASYFRDKPIHHVGPLSATHQIVSPEEAAHLDVDMAHILVPDWTDVEDYQRTLRAPRYYPNGEIPADVRQLRRIPVKGKQGKHQLISLELWKAREERRAAQRKQHLVHASAYQTGEAITP